MVTYGYGEETIACISSTMMDLCVLFIELEEYYAEALEGFEVIKVP